MINNDIPAFWRAGIIAAYLIAGIIGSIITIETLLIAWDFFDDRGWWLAQAILVTIVVWATITGVLITLPNFVT